MHDVKIALLLFLLTGTTATVAQETVLEPKSPSNWVIQRGDGALDVADENAVTYKNALETEVDIITDVSLRIDPEKSYRLSGACKTLPDAEVDTFRLGVAPLNDAGDQIAATQVNVVAGTETELAADCQPEDTEVIIKNGANWEVTPTSNYDCIAFAVDDSGNYNDLPNANLSRLGITEVTKTADGYKVTLAKSCGVRFPSGTKVRKHAASANAIYLANLTKGLPQEWKEFSGRISGASLSGNTQDKWWRGTKQAKIFINARGATGAPPQFIFKDIRLEEE